jgi:diacylglycerol kinase family enzyme
VNGRRFAFSAGLGLDAEAVRRVDALGRAEDGRRPGDLAFARALAAIVAGRRARYDPVLELAGLGAAALAFVSNCAEYTYAGPLALRIAPRARFEAGLALAAPRSVRPGSLTRYLARLAAGRGLAGAPGVLSGYDLDRIEVECAVLMPLQADGEDLGDVRSAVFVAERGAVDVLVP